MYLFLILILFFLGGYQILVLFWELGFCFVCLLGGGSSVLPNFQGLEVGSYSHHRVVGGDQSLNTCNNRKEIVGKVGYTWLIPLVG